MRTRIRIAVISVGIAVIPFLATAAEARIWP